MILALRLRVNKSWIYADVRTMIKFSRFERFLRLSCLLTFVAFIGYAAGVVSIRPLQRSLASETTPSLNSFDSLPCPTEEEYQQLAKSVNLTIPEGSSDCDNSMRAKLGKALLLTKNLKIKLPSDWQGIQKKSIEDPLGFVSSLVQQIDINLTQRSSIARNVGKTNVEIGGGFFEIEPLFAVAVLVHEAHHSAEDDPGHTRCLYGDIPKTQGGCDLAFSTEKGAGSYSYDLMYLLALGLYGQDLAKSDREWAMSSSIVRFANRFNELPVNLALLHEIVAVLGFDQKIYVLHPFIDKPLALPPIPDPDLGEITRIDYLAKRNGILAFTLSGKLWVYDMQTGWDRIYPELFGDKKIIEYTKLYFPSEGGSSYSYALDDQSGLYFIDVDPSNGKFILAQDTYQPSKQSLQFRRMTLAQAWDSLFLSNEGSVYRLIRGSRGAADRYLNYNQFVSPDNKGWQYIYGGVTYDSLFGINGDGMLYRNAIQGGAFVSVPVQLFSQVKLQKYVEGISGQFGLDTDGKLRFARWGDGVAISMFDDLAVKDFAIVRRGATRGSWAPVFKENKKWAGQCLMTTYVREPWLGGSLGIDIIGQAVWKGAYGRCRALAKGVSEISIDDLKKINAKNFYESGLKIKFKDEHEELRLPYSGKY